MRKATSEAVTPGTKRKISVSVPPRLWSGAPAAAILELLWAWIIVKIMMATSKTLIGSVRLGERGIERETYAMITNPSENRVINALS